MALKKILIVDDSVTSLMWQKMILKGGPYEVITAQDGEEAVAKAVEERPDLILLDVVMPRLDGLGACKAIRQNAVTRETPIIMVTTRADMESMEQAFANGCNDYVTKPIDKLELLTKIEAYLGTTKGGERDQ